MKNESHMKKYDGLYNLIEKDDGAEEYFDALPEYVKDSICQRAENICSRSDLESYAGNLLRGDL